MTSPFRIVIVPGWRNSGPSHWQSLWAQAQAGIWLGRLILSIPIWRGNPDQALVVGKLNSPRAVSQARFDNFSGLGT